MGQQLSVPAGISNIRNSAATFRVYDPNRATGDLSPLNPKPQARPGTNCGPMGTILLAAVAIGVTIVTAGAAVAALSPGLSLATGISTFAAGGGALGTGAMIGIGAVSGAVGSLASQALGIATGQQRGFDWKAVAMAGISGAVGAGLGLAVPGRGVHLQALRAMAGSAIGQGIGVATRLQAKFDWAGVASAGLGAAGAGAVGSWGGGRFAVAGASLLSNAAARSLVTGTSFGDDILRALPDTIGSTIGNMIADGIVHGRGGTARSRSVSAAETPSAINVNDAALRDAVERAFPMPDTPGLGKLELSLDRARDFVDVSGAEVRPGVTAVRELSDGTYLQVEVDEDGQWDISSLAYGGGGRPEPVYMNRRFGPPTSSEIVTRRVVGGPNDGAFLRGQESSTPTIFRDRNGAAFVYQPTGPDTVVPLNVREISSTEMTIRRGASVAADFVPVLGAGKLIGQLISGRDAYTGEPVSRLLMAAGAAGGLVGAALLGRALGRSSGNAADAASTRARILDNIAASQAARATSNFVQHARFGKALDFYVGGGWTVSGSLSHLRGIDISRPVDVVRIPAGTRLIQYQPPEGQMGSYFAPPGTPASQLGINPSGKVMTAYQATTEVTALRSTAASIIDNWSPGGATQAFGGGIQYFTHHPYLFK